MHAPTTTSSRPPPPSATTPADARCPLIRADCHHSLPPRCTVPGCHRRAEMKMAFTESAVVVVAVEWRHMPTVLTVAVSSRALHLASPGWLHAKRVRGMVAGDSPFGAEWLLEATVTPQSHRTCDTWPDSTSSLICLYRLRSQSRACGTGVRGSRDPGRHRRPSPRRRSFPCRGRRGLAQTASGFTDQDYSAAAFTY